MAQCSNVVIQICMCGYILQDF